MPSGPSTPRTRHEWEERLLKRVDALEKKPLTTMWGSRINLRTTPQFLALIHRAAFARDMNLGSYIRRCVAKQIAADLDMTWEEVLALTPKPLKYGQVSYSGRKAEMEAAAKGVDKPHMLPDDGEGFGEW